MKQTTLFKTLVDILYFLHFAGLIIIIVFLPLGLVNINQLDTNIEDSSLFYWAIGIVILLTYLIFLRGLYFLRLMSKYLLANNYFSELITTNLKKSGVHFLVTGGLFSLITFLLWMNNLQHGKFELGIDSSLIIPLFLIMIGLFFIIQSRTLSFAKNIKDENDLTV